MKVQFELSIGQNKFTLVEDINSHKEFFKKLHFYSMLPKVGPNGETDLEVTYRKTKDGYEYMSIASKTAGMEFKFGQYKESPGELFPKGWEPLYQPDETEQQESATPVVGIQQTPAVQQVVYQQPQVVQPQPQVVQPQPQVVQQPVYQQPQVVQPQVQQVSQPVQQAQPAAPAAAQAVDILAKFGI